MYFNHQVNRSDNNVVLGIGKEYILLLCYRKKKNRKEKENNIIQYEIPSITPNINQLSFLCFYTSRWPLQPVRRHIIINRIIVP